MNNETQSAEADAQREPELSNAEIAHTLVCEWNNSDPSVPLMDSWDEALVSRIKTALDAKDTRSRPTVEAAEIRRQAFDDAIAEVERCFPDSRLVMQSVVVAALTAARDAAPTPPEDSGDEATDG